VSTPLDYEPQNPDPPPTLRDWLKLLWPWALILGFIAFCACVIVAHPGGE
jgi:hypothetical protein